MDFKTSSKIWSTDLNGTEKMVLLALDHSGDQDGFSWQGYAKLAEMTGINAESKYLTRILNKLEKDGYILIWRQHGHKGGRGYTHIYWPIIGRSDEEIMETVMRRFVATEDEARAIIRQSGPVYDELVKCHRISGKILEQTRAKKGVLQYTDNDEKGVLEAPHLEQKVYQDTPKNEEETEKGVLEAPRSIESLKESKLDKNIITSSNEEGGKPPPTEAENNQPPNGEPARSPPKLEYTPFLENFLAYFNAKRFKNRTQHKTVSELTEQHGETEMASLAEWAANKGMGLGQAIPAIKSALNNPKRQKHGANQSNGHRSDSQPISQATGLGEWEDKDIAELRATGEFTEEFLASLKASRVPVTNDG